MFCSYFCDLPRALDGTMEIIENTAASNDVLKAEIKSILAFKAKEGATFHDIKNEYAYLMGKKLCFDSAKPFKHFMRTMPDVFPVKGADGQLHWFSNSNKSKHIATMVENQKRTRQNSPLKRKLFYNSTSTCYYNDNYIYKNKRNYKSDCSLNEIQRGYTPVLIYNYELIGDDFFLNIANLDLKYRLEYLATKTGYKGRPIKKCGHCVSGQSIRKVTAIVKSDAKLKDSIILNVGSVDLLLGRDFIEMRKDFLELYAELERREIHTVITTLAPLANMLYSKEIQKRWHLFNMFLLNEFSDVIDITCCFVSNTSRVLFECYQPEPKYVSGCNSAHLLWNFVGRQRALKHLKDSLVELTYTNSILNDNV